MHEVCIDLSFLNYVSFILDENEFGDENEKRGKKT